MAEDLEDGPLRFDLADSGRIEDAELLAFVGVYFASEHSARDCKASASLTNYEVNRQGYFASTSINLTQC